MTKLLKVLGYSGAGKDSFDARAIRALCVVEDEEAKKLILGPGSVMSGLLNMYMNELGQVRESMDAVLASMSLNTMSAETAKAILEPPEPFDPMDGAVRAVYDPKAGNYIILNQFGERLVRLSMRGVVSFTLSGRAPEDWEVLG